MHRAWLARFIKIGRWVRQRAPHILEMRSLRNTAVQVQRVLPPTIAGVLCVSSRHDMGTVPLFGGNVSD